MREVLKIYITVLKVKENNTSDDKVEHFSNKVRIVHLQWYDKYEEEVEIQDIGDNFLFCTT